MQPDADRMPDWAFPPNLAALVDEAEGFLEDDRWHPIEVTLIGGTTYEGRDIPLSWQVSFSPGQPVFAAANMRHFGRLEADGYGWADLVASRIRQPHPEAAEEIHDDSENSTFVMWAETEAAGKVLLETVWDLTRGA